MTNQVDPDPGKRAVDLAFEVVHEVAETETIPLIDAGDRVVPCWPHLFCIDSKAHKVASAA